MNIVEIKNKLKKQILESKYKYSEISRKTSVHKSIISRFMKSGAISLENFCKLKGFFKDH